MRHRLAQAVWHSGEVRSQVISSEKHWHDLLHRGRIQDLESVAQISPGWIRCDASPFLQELLL